MACERLPANKISVNGSFVAVKDMPGLSDERWRAIGSARVRCTSFPRSKDDQKCDARMLSG